MAQLDELETIAAMNAEPRHVSAAGVTRSGGRLVTLENPDPFTPSRRRRLVLIADDGRAQSAVAGALRWFKLGAPAALRERWALSAVLPGSAGDAAPAARLTFPPLKGFFDDPEQPESRYLWRWVSYQAPDLVVQVRGGDVLSRNSPPPASLAAALAGGSELGTVPSMFVTARASDGGALIRYALEHAGEVRESEVRATLRARVDRTPLAIARVLAGVYPQNPSVSYIPSVAWASTLRLADATLDETAAGALRQKVLDQTAPWRSRERPLFGDRVSLTAAAGALIYADLAARGDRTVEPLAFEAADAAARLAPSGYAQHGQGWTDDMFMMAAVLARTGRLPGRSADLDHLAARLLSYAARLQRSDGIFVHFTDGRIAWGRGNGFAALGLAEALTSLPARHASRVALVEVYRRQMRGLAAMQAPDGMWRQVIDEPGAYREESATAMTIVAMARGVRLGWIDGRTFRPAIDRAWRALAAHVTGQGHIVDVCTSTGSQATLGQYLDRPAISGPDDRGGAMALFAAMELHASGPSGSSGSSGRAR